MRMPVLLALAAITLLAGPALAQSTTGHPPAPRRVNGYARSSDGVPVDHGPYTAQANGAYQGGGVVLQGPPGGPAPVPQLTPPGQMPANMAPTH